VAFPLNYKKAYASGGDDMGNHANNRRRNTIFMFIAAGIFLLISKIITFSTIVAILFIFFGVRSVRMGSQKKGYIFIGIGAFIFLGALIKIVIGIIVLSFGLFYLKSKQVHWNGIFTQKLKIIESMQWNKRSWSLRPMSVWNIIGEIKLDLSLAIWEEPEVTIVLQGVIGDIDVIVPENVGVSVVGTVIFGQIEAELEKEAGVWNKINFQSTNYHTSSNKLKLIVSYIVADVDVKII